MTNCVIRQPSTPPASLPTGVALEALPHGTDWPGTLVALVAHGLTDGHDFLGKVAAQWQDPGGPYARPGAAMLLAVAGTRVVGLAGIVQDPFLADPRTGRLKHVFVDPAWRGRGLAEALVIRCIADARPHHDRLRLRTANPVAARLYERLGFERRPAGPDCTHVLTFREGEGHGS